MLGLIENKNIYIEILLKISSTTLGFITTILMAKLLGAEGIGYFSSTMSFLLLLAGFFILGLDTSILSISNQEGYNGEYLFIQSTILILFIFLSLSSLFLFLYENQSLYRSSLIERFFDYKLYIAVIFLITTRLINAFFRLKNELFYYSLTNNFLLQLFLFLCLCIGLFFNFEINSNEEIINSIIFISSLLTFLIASYLFKNNGNFRLGNFKLFYSFLMKVKKLSIPQWFSANIVLLLTSVELIILTEVSDLTYVGVYAIALKIAWIFGLFASSSGNILAGKLVIKNNNEDKIQNIIRDLIYKAFLLNVILFIGFCLIFPLLLNFLGEEFDEVGSIIWILILSQIINSLTGPVGYVLHLNGAAHFASLIYVCILFILLIFLPIAFEKFGLIGFAYFNLFTTVIWNLIFVIYSREKFNVKII